MDADSLPTGGRECTDRLPFRRPLPCCHLRRRWFRSSDFCHQRARGAFDGQSSEMIHTAGVAASWFPPKVRAGVATSRDWARRVETRRRSRRSLRSIAKRARFSGDERVWRPARTSSQNRPNDNRTKLCYLLWYEEFTIYMYITMALKELYIAFISSKCINTDVRYFYTCINVTC